MIKLEDLMQAHIGQPDIIFIVNRQAMRHHERFCSPLIDHFA